jgi:hypothetical protein
MRPLKNVSRFQRDSKPRKVKILTRGIHVVFRGLKFKPDAGIGQKGAFFKSLITLLFALFLFQGCATSEKRTVDELKNISLGMHKKEVLESLGQPTVARGAIRNKYSQIIEVWEYTLALPEDESEGSIISKKVITVISDSASALGFKVKRKDYWLYFYDDTLVRWGEVGDWSEEIDNIYESKFNKPDL